MVGAWLLTHQLLQKLLCWQACLVVSLVSHTRLTTKPFPEKSIDNVASTSICVRTELEANGGVSGGAPHKFYAICHGRETAEMF